VTEKTEYLTSLFKRVANAKIHIEEIKTINGIVKTKEKNHQRFNNDFKILNQFHEKRISFQ